MLFITCYWNVKMMVGMTRCHSDISLRYTIFGSWLVETWKHPSARLDTFISSHQ